MNNPSAAEIQALSQATKNFPSPTYAIRPPMTFLSLAPALSTSYPASVAKSSVPQTDTALVNESAVVDGTTVPAILSAGTGQGKVRRSSSTTSDESTSNGMQRFLRLGNHGVGDWSEPNVAE